MTDNDSLLEQSLQCLSWHCQRKWGDRVPLDVFNRLLAKSIRPAGWTPNTHLNLQSQQIKSRRETWTTEQLGTLCRHKHIEGDDLDCPIIVAEYEGTQRLLDGNHRINRWTASGDVHLHDVNIHKVIGTGEFVEFPAVDERA